MSSVEPALTSAARKTDSDFHSRLDNHFLACSAFAGAAALLAAPDASAAIVYSGTKNLPVSTAQRSEYIDLDTGTFSNTQLAGYDLFFYRQSLGAIESINVTPGLATQNGIDATVTVYSSSSSSSSTITTLNKLATGKLISSKDKFAPGGRLGAVTTHVTSSSSSSSSSTPTTTYSGAWGHGGTGFVGFKFVSAQNTPLYGWARLVVGADMNTTVVDWAYEDAGQPIIAGQTSENTVTVRAAKPTATEGGAPAKVKFHRTGDTSAPLEVHFKLKSKHAAAGTDYPSLPTSVIIPAGSKSASLTIGAIDNTVKDGTRNLNVKLLSGYGYLVGTGDKATVSILDND